MWYKPQSSSIHVFANVTESWRLSTVEQGAKSIISWHAPVEGIKIDQLQGEMVPLQDTVRQVGCWECATFGETTDLLVTAMSRESFS